MNLLLKNKIYRFITYSDILSVIGDSFFYLAFLTYASTLENSAIAISIISISESLPEVFSMFTGVYADKVKDKAKADIYSNFLRMFIYFFVAISFLIFKNLTLVIIVSIFNLFSDIVGTFSDTLRFPIIYAILEKKDFDKSVGISMFCYYSFDFLAKFIGAIVIVLLNYNYFVLSNINALTFFVAGLIMLKVYRKLKVKMDKFEETKEDGEKEDEKIDFSLKKNLKNVKKLFKNENIKKSIIFSCLISAINAPVLPIIYVCISNNDFYIFGLETVKILSILNVVVLLGVILGNLVITKDILWSKYLQKIIFFQLFCIILSFLNILFLKEIITTCILLFFVSLNNGLIFPIISGVLMNNQEYGKLASTVGFLNTIETILPVCYLQVILFILNINFTLSIVISTIVAFCSVIYSLNWKMKE